MHLKKIYWKFILNSQKDKVVSGFLEKISDIIEGRIIEKKIYWKDNSKFEILVEQEISLNDIQGILFKILGHCYSFSSDWNVLISEISNNNISLSAVSSQGIRFSELYWLNVEIE